MTYRFLVIEASAPPPATELTASEAGVGVLVLHRGVPVGFTLQERRGRLTSADMASLINRSGGLGATRAAIREELGLSDPAAVDVTIAVCTRDRPERLRRCLDSVIALDRGSHRVRLLVVDNAPRDNRTRDVVAEYRDVDHVVEPRPGLDIARNRALEACESELLAFVDDDVVLDPGWLDGLAGALAENPEAAAITGFVGPMSLDTPAQILFERRGGFRRGFELRRFAVGSAYRVNHPFGTGGFGTGANMVFRTAVLRELGGFDPALDTGRPLPGGGDLDAFFRVLADGHVLVYAPGMSVRHEHRQTIRQLRRQYWTWGSGYLAFLHATFLHRADQRRSVVRALLWWMRRESAATWAAARGRDPAPVRVAGAPLVGGLLTGLWKYPLSVLRRR